VKKVLTALCISLLVIGTMLLSSCSMAKDKDTSIGAAALQNNSVQKKIGIVQIVEHPSLNTIRETIIKGLKEKGFEDGVNISIDYQNAQADQSNLKAICQKFANNRYDLIIAIATPSAQAAAGETKDIPILFSACTDPIASGLVSKLDKPGKNITGTSDRISTEQIMKLAKRITPEIGTIGVLYSTNETSSQIAVSDLKKYAEDNNIRITEATVTNTSEVNQAIQSLVDQVDVIFAPADNTIATAMPLVSSVAIKAKKPLYVGTDSMVKDGGLATCGINYVVLGKQTVDMAVEILNGEKPGDIPIRVMEDLNIYVNKDTSKKIGVAIPDDVLKEAAQVFGE